MQTELQTSKSSQGETPRVLMYSRRGYDLKMYQSFVYEFEDVISQVDSVRALHVPRIPLSYGQDVASRLANRGRKFFGAFQDLEPGVPEIEVTQDYEMFFMNPMFPHDLLLLRRLKNWRKRCKVAVCFLLEIWSKEIAASTEYLKLLSEFDFVFALNPHCIDAIRQYSGRPVHYLPVAVDTEKFCPYPADTARVIDCLSVGRRLAPMHEVLREMTGDGSFFYIYDTAHNFQIMNYEEHRALGANMAKRSRYYVCHRHPKDDVVLPRMFEGAASGTVMIGQRPASPEFEAAFNWPDAVVSIPERPEDIPAFLRGLDAQRDRMEAARVNNVRQCLLRHDWMHRWQTILDTIGMPALDQLRRRQTSLQELADSVPVRAQHHTRFAGIGAD